MGKQNGNNEPNGNGNGAHHYDVGEPEYFLPALLAAHPILYLVDAEGNPVDAEGKLVGDDENGAGLPPGLRQLQREAMRTEPIEDPPAASQAVES
jgi:hypothetical protein